MYVKAILPSNVVYYEVADGSVPSSVNFKLNQLLDPSGNEIPYTNFLYVYGDKMEGAHALISEVSVDPFTTNTTTETKSDY